MQRRLILAALVLLVSAAVWHWRSPAATCLDCLPLPDVQSLLLPPPKMDLPYPAPPAPDAWKTLTAAQRLADVTQRVLPLLRIELEKSGLQLGQPVYLRAFKESRELELWMQAPSGWELWRTYPIAAASGRLGPKQKEGDLQVPEGLYAVTARQMNPASSYHLAFNIGYPNAHDLKLQRTGSHIMIHGAQASVGCLAMTDPVIEEIYLLVQAAQAKAQPAVPVHLFPFRMTPERLAAASSDPWHPFWKTDLLPTYQHFETHRTLPTVAQ